MYFVGTPPACRRCRRTASLWSIRPDLCRQSDRCDPVRQRLGSQCRHISGSCLSPRTGLRGTPTARPRGPARSAAPSPADSWAAGRRARTASGTRRRTPSRSARSAIRGSRPWPRLPPAPGGCRARCCTDRRSAPAPTRPRAGRSPWPVRKAAGSPTRLLERALTDARYSASVRTTSSTGARRAETWPRRLSTSPSSLSSS